MMQLSALTTRLALAGSLFLPLAATSAATAQNFDATIPFSFQEGSQVFHPGTYRINCSQTGLILLRSTNGDQAKYALTTGEERKTVTKNGLLIFHRYGNAYFLSDFWLPGQPAGVKFWTTDAEKRLRRTPPSDVVALNVTH